jgi:molybdopterin-containing oxidoreductase family membrane subunit
VTETTTDPNTLFRPVFETGKYYYWVIGFLAAVVGFGAYQWARQVQEGVGYAGMNRPVYWGFYLVNYVFFIGISHAGNLISSILRLTHTEWRRPLTRIAEVVAVLGLGLGASNVIWHLGRPELFWMPMLHPQFLSPLVWDLVAINLYLLASITYLYLPLIPDIALLRDRSPRRRAIYRPLALGYTGTERQVRILEKAISTMAVAVIPIAVTVHSVLAWVFGMTLVPMWHSTILGPYFVVGAIFSGIAALILAMAILRRAFHLEAFIRPVHFNNLGILLLVMCCVWAYFTFAEHLTTWYGNLPDEMAVFESRFSGDFAIPFWAMVAGCLVLPFPILAFKKTRTVAGTVVASLAVLAGMWIERFIIVVGSASHPRLHSAWDGGAYQPSLVEIAMTAAQFAAFALFIALFAKLFPIVSIWEQRPAEASLEPVAAPAESATS